MRAVVLAAILLAAPAWAETATVMSYSDKPFQDNYTATVLDPFNHLAAGNQAAFHGSNNSATMLGELRTQRTAPQVDVVIMDTTTAAIACAEGLVEKITPAMVPELADLDPNARDPNGCGPAVTFDHFIIAYDTKAVTPAPTSLLQLADPQWKGKVALSAPPNIQALALTAILAQSESGDWRHADAAFKTLAGMAPNVQTFDPQPDGYTLILNGTLDFATGWNARAQLFHDRSAGRLGVMLPQEGTALQLNMINLVKGAPHRAAALAFIRYALSPPAQKSFTERMFYGPTNLKADISPAAAARTSAGAATKSKIVPVDWNEMIKLRERWTQRWRREVIAAGGADLSFLRLERLRRQFGTAIAVRDLSLDVPQGALLALLGPSGCGKTTTLRMVAGLEPPDAGRVLANGRDLTALPPYARRMGVVFQSYALFPHLSVLANVGFGLRMQRVASTERRRRAIAALEMVGLAAHAGKRPRQLSGGQQQRVAVARALAIEPDVLLLDEPLSALDAKLREELRLELRALQRRVGATSVFVTHDQTEALAMADLVAVMHEGALAQLGTPEDVFERPASPFVAEFVGRSARLHGLAEPGGLRAGPAFIRAAAPPAGPVQAFVRPHRIRLLDPADAADNALDGTVAALDYTGETVQVLVDTGAGRVPVDLSTAAPAWRALHHGAPVRLGWAAADTLCFPA